jgi:hypothetical protein
MRMAAVTPQRPLLELCLEAARWPDIWSIKRCAGACVTLCSCSFGNDCLPTRLTVCMRMKVQLVHISTAYLLVRMRFVVQGQPATVSQAGSQGDEGAAARMPRQHSH